MEKQLHNALEQAFPELMDSPHLLTTQIWNDCLVNRELLFETVERLAPGEFNESQLTGVWSWAVRQYQKRQESKEVVESDLVSLTEQTEDFFNEDLNFTDEKSSLDEEDDTLLLYYINCCWDL